MTPAELTVSESTSDSATDRLSAFGVFRRFRWRVATTWFLVLVETALLALIPLGMGKGIDALLEGRPAGLIGLIATMVALVAVAMLRRAYDTRAYGTMRVWLGTELVRRNVSLPVSRLTARLSMSREIVDFLEHEVAMLIGASVQICVALLLLFSFDASLGFTGTVAMMVLALLYLGFHRCFYRLNGQLNSQVERQVAVLNQRRLPAVTRHLTRLRRCEVWQSDAEAILYGIVYLAMFALVLGNLYLAAELPSITAGTIFAILGYSWELVDAAVALPMAMQQWSRQSELRARLET